MEGELRGNDAVQAIKNELTNQAVNDQDSDDAKRKSTIEQHETDYTLSQESTPSPDSKSGSSLPFLFIFGCMGWLLFFMSLKKQ